MQSEADRSVQEEKPNYNSRINTFAFFVFLLDRFVDIVYVQSRLLTYYPVNRKQLKD